MRTQTACVKCATLLFYNKQVALLAQSSINKLVQIKSKFLRALFRLKTHLCYFFLKTVVFRLSHKEVCDLLILLR